MSQYFEIHPTHPQKRLVLQAVEILRNGGLVVYPTDSSYAIGCHIGDKDAMERIQRIRKLDDKHFFSLVCKDLSKAQAERFFRLVDRSLNAALGDEPVPLVVVAAEPHLQTFLGYWCRRHLRWRSPPR